MFYQIMETVEAWYVSKEILPPPKVFTSLASRQNLETNLLFIQCSGSMQTQPFAKINEFHSSNVIITKLTRIQDYLLRRVNNELYAHLISMDIPPQIYGM
jgi:TBC1 domain family protein 5